MRNPPLKKLLNAYKRGVFCVAILCVALTPVCGQEVINEDTVKESSQEKWKQFWISTQNYWLYTPDYTTHREPKRSFEMGAVFSAGFAWDLYLSFLDIFKKDSVLEINFNEALDNLSLTVPSGLNINIPVEYQFLYTKFRYKQDRTFTMSFFNISENLSILFSEDLFVFFAQGNTKKYNIEPAIQVSGAIFVEFLSFGWERKIFGDYFISVKPAWYLPLVYIPKSVQKIKISAEDSFILELQGSVKAYVPFSFVNGFEITNYGGVDLDLCVERSVFNILDVGLDLRNLPLMPSVLSNVGEAGIEGVVLDASNSVFEGININIPELEQFYRTSNFWVFRPIRTDIYALYRPFGRDSLVFRPNAGITFLNPSEELFVNLGLSVSFQPVYWFTATFFTGMEEKLGKNEIGLSFSWRNFGFWLKVDMRSQDYFRAWTLKGAGFSVGWLWGY
ncbi:MAG: hypothetical protein LBC53_03885 [Spirochaetaceae bacterium]|nr:hypothetical protein [Spirochaetaceae bacterium]